MTINKLKKLQDNLVRQGVSWKHASRYIRELENHYDDLFVEAKSRGFNDKTASYMAEQALGDEQSLMDEMTSRPELQSFGQRYPKLCYLVLPIMLYVGISIGIVLFFAAFMETFFPSTSEQGIAPDYSLKFVVEGARLFLMHALAPLLSMWFLFYGMRNRISRKLLYTGILLANLFSCALLIRIQWPDPAAGITEGSVGATIGYGFYGARDVMETKLRLLLTLAGLALCAWWYRNFLIRD